MNNNNELLHYGVLGMKWGRRKGSSALGKIKQKKVKTAMSDEELTSSVKRMALESQYSKLKKQTEPASKTEKAKRVVDEASGLVNQARNINKSYTKPKARMNLSKMTDQQLRDRINRENLERQYNDMFASPAKISKGKKYLTNILEGTGSALAIGSSALGIALAIKQLKK